MLNKLFKISEISDIICSLSKDVFSTGLRVHRYQCTFTKSRLVCAAVEEKSHPHRQNSGLLCRSGVQTAVRRKKGLVTSFHSFKKGGLIEIFAIRTVAPNE